MPKTITENTSARVLTNTHTQYHRSSDCKCIMKSTNKITLVKYSEMERSVCEVQVYPQFCHLRKSAG